MITDTDLYRLAVAVRRAQLAKTDVGVILRSISEDIEYADIADNEPYHVTVGGEQFMMHLQCFVSMDYVNVFDVKLTQLREVKDNGNNPNNA